jgi:hypothetical protein
MFEMVAKALQKQIFNAFNKVYFLFLYNQVTGYEATTVLQLLNHLYLNYGNIDSTHLEYIKSRPYM